MVKTSVKMLIFISYGGKKHNIRETLYKTGHVMEEKKASTSREI